MGAGSDDIKGRMKEAAGAVADDDDLRREGKADQLGAKVKAGAEKVQEGVERLVDEVKGRFRKNDA